MKRVLISVMAVLGFTATFAQGRTDFPMKPEMTEIWDPEITVITPGATPQDAPSDAIVLFDGKTLIQEWTSEAGSEPGWKVDDGCATVVKGAGIIKTKRDFNDFQLHIEWRTPSEVVKVRAAEIVVS